MLFRSVKLWFVPRNYGIHGLQEHLQKGITLAERLESWLNDRFDLFAIFAPARFALLSFQVKGIARDHSNALTEALYTSINEDGEFYVTSTTVDANFVIRVCTGVAAVQEYHVQRLFDVFVEKTTRLISPQSTNAPDEERSVERRVGRECNSRCISRWSPYY